MIMANSGWLDRIRVYTIICLSFITLLGLLDFDVVVFVVLLTLFSLFC